MVVGINVELKFDGALALSRKKFNDTLKQEYEEIGLTWHKKHRPRHFTLDGARRYGYAKRSRGYNRSKKRQFGHTLPLVKTGKSRARATQISRIKPTRTNVSVSVPVRTFNFRPANSNVNMRKEFSTIARDEVQVYERQFKRNVERKLQGFRAPKQRIK